MNKYAQKHNNKNNNNKDKNIIGQPATKLPEYDKTQTTLRKSISIIANRNEKRIRKISIRDTLTSALCLSIAENPDF